MYAGDVRESQSNNERAAPSAPQGSRGRVLSDYRASVLNHFAYWQRQAEWAAKQLQWYLEQVEYFTNESRRCREEIEKLEANLDSIHVGTMEGLK